MLRTPLLLARVWPCLGLLAALWPAAARPVAGQALLPLRAVHADADADYVADRLGDTLTVAGRLTVAPGLLSALEQSAYLQDATGGVRLADVPPRGFARGDSLVVTGVVEQETGAVTLRVLLARAVATPPAVPLPRPLRLGVDTLESAEGQLVAVEGYVVGKGRVAAGEYLNLVYGSAGLVVFLHTPRRTDASFEDFGMGDYVRVVGLLGQYDRAPPFDASYQVYPRAAADVARAGLPPVWYRRLLWAAVALLALAVAGVLLLRSQVRRRVAQLRGAETRYHTLFEYAGDPVFVHPPALDAPLREANAEACRLLGYGAAQLAGRSLRALVAPGDHAAADAHQRLLEADGQAATVLRLCPQAGPPIPFEVHSHRVLLHGRPTVLSIARDFRQRQAYEEGLIEARRQAEQLARLKSEFLANMSHEIRTPLTGILGYAEVLHDEVGDEHRTFVGVIEESGRRLLATLNSVLDLARLDADQVALHAQPLDVVAETREALALLHPLAARKGLSLRLATPLNALPACLDAACLHRTLNNLIGNALKFTETGGVTVTLRHEAGLLVLAVEDTGRGIRPDFLPHLFTQFRQEGSARSQEGTGLGLAITQRLVQLQGGTIEVASTLGQGTRFTVRLPYVPVPAEAPASGCAPGCAPDCASGCAPTSRRENARTVAGGPGV